MRIRVALSLLLLLLVAGRSFAQQVASPQDVLGHALGDRFTDAADAVRYAESLAAASDRVSLVRMGTTTEGRPLLLMVLASPANAARLEAVLQANARLTDPELPASEASAIAASNPAVAWFTYGVHGDESASTEAALWTAWDLATDGQGSAGLLDSLVVVIDPVANPDGRERYVQWYRGARGAVPNPDPASREHHPPWPGGRYNHYLFDLNRDWTWGRQAETRARLREWGRWNPQVHVDFHEMGFASTYFFFPAAEPVNPVYPDYTVRWAEYFGRANAAEFDRRRWLYYSGETFDLFYPGFGDSWPSLVGAVGMTYEQAGSGRAGLVVRRPDGTELTLADRAMHHRIAGLTTLRAAASRKSDLLREFAAFHRSQGQEAADVLLVPGPDSTALRDLVALLHAQGIRVERAQRSFRAEAMPHPGYSERGEFPVGTMRVRSRQPRGRLAVTLLQSETMLDPGVTGTYDITAWSLPYAYGVEAHSTGAVQGASFAPVPVLVEAEEAAVASAAYGWLVPPTFDAAGPLFRHLSSGGRAFALRKGFRLQGERWPAGTVFVPADEGAADRLAASGLAPLSRPVASGRTTEGRDLGTGSSITLTSHKIGVLIGRGFSATGAGAVWYLLEAMAGIPFDALDPGSTGRIDLSAYDVLVLPSGSPRRASEAVADRISEWVERGGTLVTIGSSSGWAASSMTDVAQRGRDEAGGEVDPMEARRLGLRTVEERRSDAWDDAVQGIVLPLVLDPDHPLAWGVGAGNDEGAAFALRLSDLAFEPSTEHETVASFDSEVQALSGSVSAAKLAEFASSSWLSIARAGDGKVIMFADDPLFRLMWPANFLLFTNAILYGPHLR